MNIKTTRDDIHKRQEEYQKAFNETKARYDSQYKSYSDAEDIIYDKIKNSIKESLSGVCLSNVEIKVDRSMRSHVNGKGIEAEIRSDEHRVHAEDKALSWSWSVHYSENGEITKKSSSWSGLQAITKEQIESLRQTLKTLEILNDIEWEDILNVTLPQWSDYITEDNPSYDKNKPDFEKELFEYDLSETIGKNVLIKGVDVRNNRHIVWYHILRETEKQYVIKSYYDNSIEKLNSDELAEYVEKYQYDERITKDKLRGLLNKPVVTMAF